MPPLAPDGGEIDQHEDRAKRRGQEKDRRLKALGGSPGVLYRHRKPIAREPPEQEGVDHRQGNDPGPGDGVAFRLGYGVPQAIEPGSVEQIPGCTRVAVVNGLFEGGRCAGLTRRAKHLLELLRIVGQSADCVVV